MTLACVPSLCRPYRIFPDARGSAHNWCRSQLRGQSLRLGMLRRVALADITPRKLLSGQTVVRIRHAIYCASTVAIQPSSGSALAGMP
jgi:hypothetical protein